MSTSEIKKYLAILDEPVVQQDKQYVLTEASAALQRSKAIAAKAKSPAATPTAPATTPTTPTTATTHAPSAAGGTTSTAPGVTRHTSNPNNPNRRMAEPGGAATPAAATPAAAPIEPAQDTGKNNIFQNPKLFQDAWAKYTASKPNYQLASDARMLQVLQNLWMEMGGTKLQESVFIKERDILVESMARRHPIYESVYDATRYLCEADLSQEQIQQVFKAVADGAAKGMNIDKEGDDPSSNRTFLGKGADVASKISAAWNKVKTAISQSGPVSGFDMAVDSMQNQIMDKLGGKGGAVGKALTGYRKFAKEHPFMQGAIYAVFVAALAAATGGTGPVALASIAGGLKLTDKLLQGDKASSAIWKGFKAGAIAGTGAAAHQYFSGAHGASQGGGGGGSTSGGAGTEPDVPYGNGSTSGGAGTEPDVPYGNGGGPGVGDVSGNSVGSIGMDSGTEYIAKARDNLSVLAKKFNVSVDELMKANPQISNPNDLGIGEKIMIPGATNNPIYSGGVGTAADTAAKVASGAYTPSRYGIKESSYNLYNPYIDWRKTVKSMKLAESKGRRTYTVYVTESGRKEVFRVVHEGIWNGIKTAAKKGWEGATNKITLSKLDMNWRRNYGDNPIEGSVDVDKIKEFLKKQGVKDYLINYALGQIGIESGGAGAMDQMANQLTVDREPASTSSTSSTGGTITRTSTGTVNKASNGNPNQSAGQAAPATTINDYKTLRSEWEDFSDSGQPVAPGVKGIIKNILQPALAAVKEDVEHLKFISLLK
jgi:LysM repeat protein